MARNPLETQLKPSPIPPEILQEIEIYEGEVARFQRGEIPADQFKPFRLQHGVYGQRQAGVQMFRVKIPQGRLTPLQLRQLADLAETYATGVLHLTTRQNIQMHFVKLENTGTMMRLLAEVGLTTREACADTVRNVTACPFAGVSPDEVVDVTPYGLAITRYFLRNPICQKLPRKFKIALEGCPEDHIATPFHDIGITAVKKGDNGSETIGFRVTVGGGLGPFPRVGHLLVEHAPPEDLIPICEAIIRVFDRHGQRKNRHRARLKFLIEKFGFQKFSDLWKAECEALKKIPNGYRVFPLIEETPRETPAEPRDWTQEKATGPLARWLETNVIPQKQAGYHVVIVKVPMGDIRTATLRALADLCEKFADGYLRVTQQQNFALRWIHHADLPALHESLIRVGLGDPGAERIENIVACPGTDSCGLSITNAKGLGRVLAEMFPPGDPANDDITQLRIKVSGCHNSCAQHHLADIGFHGVSKKVGNHIAPMYEVHLGGTDTAIALNLLKIPAKNAQAMVKHVISMYREQRQNGESFRDFVQRIGKATMREILIPFTMLPTYEEDSSYYVDWGDDHDFSVEDLGPGECAGGAYELMEGFLYEGEQELYLASAMSEKAQYGNAANKAYRSVIASTKALLVTEGIDTSIDSEVLSHAETHLIAKGMLSAEFKGLVQRIGDPGHKDPSPEFVRDRIAFARSYLEASRIAFERVSATLKQQKKEKAEGPEDGKKAHTAVTLDLSGVTCPMNYVKAKLKLEEMEVGQILEVILDEGEPIRNVPASLRNDGHKILEQTRIDAAHHKVVVEKV